jgi:hypothetical protein
MPAKTGTIGQWQTYAVEVAWTEAGADGDDLIFSD